jgi:hypothetical protein
MNPSEELKAMSIANSPEPQVSEEGKAAAGRIAAARAKADNTITSESLAPQAEVQVTDPQTGTAMAGLGGALEAQTDSFAQGLADTRSQREAEKNQSRTDFSSLVANRTGLEGFSLQADQDAGVFEADSALQDINNELRTEQLGRRRSVEALQGQGNLKGTTQSQVNNINRESYSKQADMAIVQLAAQGRFNSASALADRKANAMFEQEQNQIDAAKITYEDNKDLYNKAEQREFETALTDRTNRVQAEKEQMQAVQNLALQAQLDGAPPAIVSEMMKSKTLADASALGGQFVGALDREQQRASIESSLASAANSRDAINSRALDREAAATKDAQIEAAIASGAVVLNADQQDTAMKLSKDFVSQSSDFKKQVDAYNRIVSSAEDPSAAGDVAVVFNYMKMLDPGSVVRESEFALAASTGGLDEAIKNKFGKVATGEILGFTRDDFVDRAGKIYSGSLEQQIDLEETMREQAIKLYGMPENAADLIISDVRATGAVSEVVFGLTMDEMSDEQLLELTNEGLLPKQ